MQQLTPQVNIINHNISTESTHNDVELGIDINNSVFSVDNRQSGDSSADKHVNGSDERCLRCCLPTHQHNSLVADLRLACAHAHTHTRLTALFPGLPG